MTIAAAILVSIAVALNLLGAVGTLAMRDPYQRLHYLAPPAMAPLFFAAALFLTEHDKQSAFKMLMVAVLLNATNGVVTHATARAHRIREGKPPGRLTPAEQVEQGDV